MIVASTIGLIDVKVLVGRASILGLRHLLTEFRSNSPQASDPMTDIGHFLEWVLVWGAIPSAVMVSRSGSLIGIVLFSLRRKFRFPIGIASAGTGAGEASVIASDENRQAVIERACTAMINLPAVHTVLCSAQWGDDAVPGSVRPFCGGRGNWHFREIRTRLSLDGGIDTVMNRLGYKMRRNIRSYRRKAEASLGCHAVIDLDDDQRRQAVAALHSHDVYPLSTKIALRQEAALSKLPGAFAMAARDADGAWLSYLAGWRIGSETSVMWQLSQASLVKSSMSTILRSYLIEHEIARESSAVIFVGGTSKLWSRACEPAICADLLALRPGAYGTAARRLAGLLNPGGHISQLHSQTLV